MFVIPGSTDVAVSLGDEIVLVHYNGRTIGLGLADAAAIQLGLEAVLSGQHSRATSFEFVRLEQERIKSRVPPPAPSSAPARSAPAPPKAARNHKPSLDEL